MLKLAGTVQNLLSLEMPGDGQLVSKFLRLHSARTISLELLLVVFYQALLCG